MDIDKLEEIEEKYNKIKEKLSDPDIYGENDKYIELNKEKSKLEPIVELIEEYKGLKKNIEEAKKILQKNEDAGMVQLAKEELKNSEERIKEVENEVKIKLLPEDPNDKKNIIVEIRAGTGGDEAALFVADLYRMYIKYAEKNDWKYEIIDLNSTGMGGYKEIIFSLKGKYVYSRMKFE
ncbi:MAG: PCRF domain-containing protein, partial [Candidatus Mcinerneyibacterium aminivorans]